MDVSLVLSLYPPSNVTAAEFAQSNYLRQMWASFAKNPTFGPGWNAVGTARQFVVQDESSNPIAVQPAPPDMHLGVLGGESGNVAGVEVRRSSSVDGKCGVFTPVYQALAARRGDTFP